MVTLVQKSNKVASEVQLLDNKPSSSSLALKETTLVGTTSETTNTTTTTTLATSKKKTTSKAISVVSKNSTTTTPAHHDSDDEDDIRLEKGKQKKESNFVNSLISGLYSIKFCLSIIIILLIFISTISIFVATIVLQGASIDEFTVSLGLQAKLRALEFVNNFIQKPFQITESLTNSISALDNHSPKMKDWNLRIQLLFSTVVGFKLSYASFTSKDDYFFGITRNSNSYKLEYYQNGVAYESVPITTDFRYNLTLKNPNYDIDIYAFEWWSIPSETKKKGWSNLYALTSSNIWITAYQPILNSTGSVDYVVTTDLTVQDINSYLQNIQMSPNSLIYVISSTTTEMVACSKPDNEILYVYDAMAPHQLIRKKLHESSLPDVNAIGQLLYTKYGDSLKDFSGSGNQYTVNGNTYLIYMVDVDDTNDLNWNVLTIMSVDDFMGSVILFRNIVLIADCIILFVSLLIAIGVSMMITAPLVSLGNDMDALGKGELKKKPKKRRIIFHEVQKLRNHFTKMSMAVDGFMKYVPREIVSKFIGSDSASFDLGVDSKHIAILFSDIKSFTTICEATDPNTLIAILGKYFELTSEVVYRNRGVLDKYIGDSLMALFGAPDTFEFYVYYGCNAAFEMQRSLQPYNNLLEKEGKPTLYTRVGVSCGDVLVGNIGSTYRLSYTCLGDSVNLASRLEGLNKVYGTNIMVSEFCYELVKDFFLFRFLDVVAVKGKVTGVKVYEIVGRKWSPFQGDSVTIPQEKVEYCRTYNTILEDLYFKKRFGAAEKAFREYAEKFSQDSAALEMADRCRAYLNDPPPENWNGVHIATEK